MSRKTKSLEQVQTELKRAQERVDELRRQEKEATRAQQAADRKELLDAVIAWAAVNPKTAGMTARELAGVFRVWKQNREAQQAQRQEQKTAPAWTGGTPSAGA